MCEVSDWQSVAVVVFALVEFWLGKTNLVAAGSTIELILNGVKTLISLFKPQPKV